MEHYALNKLVVARERSVGWCNRVGSDVAAVERGAEKEGKLSGKKVEDS